MCRTFEAMGPGQGTEHRDRTAEVQKALPSGVLSPPGQGDSNEVPEQETPGGGESGRTSALNRP